MSAGQKWGAPYREMSEQLRNRLVREMADRVLAPNPLYEILRQVPPVPAPTRWERIRDWFVVRWERVMLAYQVLRGDDIHKDCW